MTTPLARGALLLAILLAGANALAANIVRGEARVIDGDTLIIQGKRVELYGLDAPELQQTCLRDENDWECGVDAKAALAGLVDGARVACRKELNIPVFYGECWIEGKDVNRWMVESGWAVINRRFTTRYKGQESLAKKGKLNLWSSEFEWPWRWRAERNDGVDAETARLRRCAVGAC